MCVGLSHTDAHELLNNLHIPRGIPTIPPPVGVLQNIRFEAGSKSDKFDPRRGAPVTSSSAATTSSKAIPPAKDKALLVEDECGTD
ncbi:hypothetical protein E3N88_35129 [Mikania micrantha]|uniref:Uncharacterized protein n=1 Tax=Mikania micrantha TaxID=192012 RepID=A0A5N6M032_9ASTR|nr:hypothetical protein E3N88_35129 [Mikania micrantha]